MSRLRAQNMTMPATEPSRAAERSAAAVGTVVGAVVVPLDGVLVTTASVVVGEAVPKLVSRCFFFSCVVPPSTSVAFDGYLPEPEVETPKGPGPKVLLAGMALGTMVKVVAGMDTPDVVPPTTVMVTDGRTVPVADAALLDEEPDGQPGSTMVDVTPSVTTTETELCAAARVARRGAKRDEDRILGYEFVVCVW